MSLFEHDPDIYYTNEEVNEMKKNGRHILIASRCIYDITEFVILNLHPGGNNCLIKKSNNNDNCKVDLDFHSKKAKQLWNRFKIGKLRS